MEWEPEGRERCTSVEDPELEDWGARSVKLEPEDWKRCTSFRDPEPEDWEQCTSVRDLEPEDWGRCTSVRDPELEDWGRCTSVRDTELKDWWRARSFTDREPEDWDWELRDQVELEELGRTSSVGCVEGLGTLGELVWVFDKVERRGVTLLDLEWSAIGDLKWFWVSGR